MAMECTQSDLETYRQDVDTIISLIDVDNAKERLKNKLVSDPVFRAKAEENRAVFLPILERLPSTWFMTRFLRLCDEALKELKVHTLQ